MITKLHKRFTNIIKATTGIALACAVAFVAPSAVFATGFNNVGTTGFCVPFSLPVALGEGQPYNQRVSATYCQPYRWAKDSRGKELPHQVDVLTAGAGYTSLYWDWQVKPTTYSYVDKTLGQGRATLAYDRVGSGKSTHPASQSVTLDSDAYVLHTLVQLLRFGGHGFKQVNVIGHSFGSGVVLQEASTYKDVSRVVVTGYLHDQRNPIVATRNYAANLDPAFVSAGYDSGYLTSKPDTRALSFYSASADPAVIAYDEAHKDVISLTAFLGYAAQQGAPAATNVSKNITVPVMAVVGQDDVIFCSNPAVLNCADISAVQAYEAPFYAGAPSFTAYSVASTGHDIALHPSTDGPLGSFQKINSWIQSH